MKISNTILETYFEETADQKYNKNATQKRKRKRKKAITHEKPPFDFTSTDQSKPREKDMHKNQKSRRNLISKSLRTTEEAAKIR